jgi:hypothetical protein
MNGRRQLGDGTLVDLARHQTSRYLTHPVS